MRSRQLRGEPAVKSSLCLSFLVAFSFLNCDLIASSWEEQPPAAQSEQSQGAVLPSQDGTPSISSQFVIPGPQRSLLRMAGISQKIRGDKVLPLLRRNVFA